MSTDDFPTRLRAIAASLDAATLEFNGIEAARDLAKLSSMASDLERMADGIAPRNCLKPLSVSQARLLAFMRRYITEHGVAPTRQEMGDGLGITPTAAQEMLMKLHRKGLVELIPGVARGIRLNTRTAEGPAMSAGT